MKTKISISKEPKVKVVKRLDKYENVVLFPKKLDEANKVIKRVGIPKLAK